MYKTNNKVTLYPFACEPTEFIFDDSLIEGSGTAALASLLAGKPIKSVVDNDGSPLNVLINKVEFAMVETTRESADAPEDDNCKSDEPEPTPPGPEPPEPVGPGMFRLINGTDSDVTLYCGGPNITPGTYGDMTFEGVGDGAVATVTLGPGESATAIGLTDETTIIIVESMEPGTHPIGDCQVPGTYTYGAPQLKLVGGDDLDGTVGVHIYIQGASGEHGQATFVDGDALVDIAAGGRLTVTGFPSGTQFDLEAHDGVSASFYPEGPWEIPAVVNVTSGK